MRTAKKSLFILILFLLLGMQGKAQICPLNEAVDFTATDCRGNEINLFSILDEGQAVLIHFFIYNGLCAILMPYMTNAYSIMGCNTQEVFFMEISHRDSDIDCQHWIDENHVAYPTIGVEGGGEEITTRYDVQTSNVIILIMPDRSITIHGAQELYPFSSHDVVDALSLYGGIEPHPCTGSMTVVNDSVVVLSNVSILPGRLELINNTDEDVTINSFSSAPEFNLQCLYNQEDVTNGGMVMPSGTSAAFEIYAHLTSKDTHEGIIHISTSAGDLETTLLLKEPLDASEINQPAFSITPNPANDQIIIEGEDLSHLMIFNMMGQVLDEFHGCGSRMSISTASYNNGIYFVRSGDGNTLRLVIQHHQ